jgi:hypothetical protein
MSQIPATTRNRIEAQGFLGFDDRTLTEINYWLRLSPAICMVWPAIGTALISAYAWGIEALRSWLDGFWDEALSAFREAAERETNNTKKGH